VKKALSLIILTLLLVLTPLGTSAYAGANPDVMDWTAQRLDGYYAAFFAVQGQSYHSPRVTLLPLGDTASTGCGSYSGEQLAFYCPLDEQIVIGQDLIDELSAIDDFLPAYVLSHEWAHHAQTLSGTDTASAPGNGDWDQVFTIENELRADCMAGAWMRSVEKYLNATDMSAVLLLASQIGGGFNYRVYTHGDGVERLRAVFIGYQEGTIACMAITPLDREAATPVLPSSSVPH
jgi:predicted metalloprotease